jgi:hypothetical protein
MDNNSLAYGSSTNVLFDNHTMSWDTLIFGKNKKKIYNFFLVDAD